LWWVALGKMTCLAGRKTLGPRHRGADLSSITIIP
jgi:hypothetical protein